MEKVIGQEQYINMKAFFEQAFMGNEFAVDLGMKILYVMHVLDDFVDGDDVTNDDMCTAFRFLMYDIPQNPLMTKELSTVMLSCYHQWLAANAIEDQFTDPEDNNLHKSYMLRAGAYQIYQHIAICVGGIDYGDKIAPMIFSSYGETFEAYKEEMTNA